MRSERGTAGASTEAFGVEASAVERLEGAGVDMTMSGMVYGATRWWWEEEKRQRRRVEADSSQSQR